MKQGILLEQRQILSQRLIQSMEILQMSTAELNSWLGELYRENPVIELCEPEPQGKSDREQLLSRKLEWLAGTDYQNRVYYDEDEDDRMANLKDLRNAGEVLGDYLHSQTLFLQLSEKDQHIIDYLIQSLDDSGYYTDDPHHAAEILSVRQEDVVRMLGVLKTLDPAGIGASGLSECLLLQLERQPGHSALTEAVIRDHLTAVGKNHLKDIAKALGVSTADINDCLEEIRRLNPRPGNAYNDRKYLSYITPDAVVIRFENEFEILINDYGYPRFEISSYYTELAAAADDPETKKYLREKIRQAKEIAEGLSMRTATLASVLHVIVEKQKPFFLHGEAYKQPLKLADIAEAAGLHESTVSRALRGKYLQCTYGIYPMNYFLSGTVAAKDAKEAWTPASVKALIRQIIDSEDKKKPLSDERIREQLDRQNVKISRRAVNKYRTEMGIPDKSGRKIWD